MSSSLNNIQMVGLQMLAKESVNLGMDDWQSFVVKTIEEFKNDTKNPPQPTQLQTEPVAFVKDIVSLPMLHLIAKYCPDERKNKLLEILQAQSIDVDYPPIYEVLKKELS